MNRIMDTVQLIDWHDGIVTGIVRLSWRDGYFLSSLLS